MASHFFPSFYAPQEQTFTPLFRLLNEFDQYSTQQRNCGGNSNVNAPVAFRPKFDVRETEDRYVLHGELPGVERENLHIEFTDQQTILIRGRVERSHTAGTSPSNFIEPANNNASDNAIEDAAGNPESLNAANEDAASSSTTSETHNNHQATVQDEKEAEAEENGTSAAPTPATTVVEPVAPVAAASPTRRCRRYSGKYWLTERSIGEFTRSFQFPVRVDQTDISASLKEGILTVVVPKAKKYEARRIEIN